MVRGTLSHTPSFLKTGEYISMPANRGRSTLTLVRTDVMLDELVDRWFDDVTGDWLNRLIDERKEFTEKMNGWMEGGVKR